MYENNQTCHGCHGPHDAAHYIAPVSHGTSAYASSTFVPPATNNIGAMGAMVPAYFSMTEADPT